MKSDIPAPGQLAWLELQSLESELWEALIAWRQAESRVLCSLDAITMPLHVELPLEFDIRAASTVALERSHALVLLFESWCQPWMLLVESLWDRPSVVHSAAKADAWLDTLERDHAAPHETPPLILPVLDHAETRADAVKAALYRWDLARCAAEESIIAGDAEASYAFTDLALRAVSQIHMVLHAWRVGWEAEIVYLTHEDVAALAAQRRHSGRHHNHQLQ